MSYDINLLDPVTKKTIIFDDAHQIRGGTYELGSSKEAWLNVTYNYSKYFYELIDKEKGIRKIYGMTGAESMPILKNAISKLGDDINNDYWQMTEGNAKQSLCGLLAFAQMRPDGIWEGD